MPDNPFGYGFCDDHLIDPPPMGSASGRRERPVKPRNGGVAALRRSLAALEHDRLRPILAESPDGTTREMMAPMPESAAMALVWAWRSFHRNPWETPMADCPGLCRRVDADPEPPYILREGTPQL